MFKKVQMRFFAIITSILLAIIIAVLASINLITEAVMQRQSRVVLNQIASNIEYDEKTSNFTYTPEPPGDKDHAERAPAPTSEASKETTESQESSGASSAAETNPPQTDTTNQVSTSESTGAETSSSEGSTTQDEPKPSIPSENNSSTSSVPSNTTAAAASVKPNPQTVTQPVKPSQPSSQTQPPAVQTAPQEATESFRPDDWHEPPPDGPYPPPWEWEGEEPQWDDPYYEDNYPNEDYYDFPRPDEHFEDYWNNRYSSESDSESEAYIEQEVYTSDSGTASAALAQLSGGNVTVLDGYTIVKNSPRTVFASDSAFSARRAEPVPKSMGSIDFFVLMADNDGNFLDSLNNEVLDNDVAQKYISAIIKDGASNGMLNSYQFCSAKKDNGTVMVFTDKSAEMDMLEQLNHTTILIGIISFVLLSVLAFFLSKKSIEPIKVAFEKQKQFVSDASHELKTPLTIISANADVLSDEIGENKWLNYIKSQAERMNVLVNDLLNLTRLENNTVDFVCGEFDLSKAIENTALPFECQAFESQKVFELDIQEGLTINGSERHIKQMAAIFIDNALKYSNDGGTVRISLKAQGDKKILSVYNTGSGIRDDEKDKLFERFYRSDNSRARATGGYGLGLAIAKSIIEKHKFKISVNNSEGESICFVITM